MKATIKGAAKAEERSLRLRCLVEQARSEGGLALMRFVFADEWSGRFRCGIQWLRAGEKSAFQTTLVPVDRMSAANSVHHERTPLPIFQTASKP